MIQRISRSLRPATPAPAILRLLAGSAACLAGMAITGCSTPAIPRDEDSLREAVIESARRELEHPRQRPMPATILRDETATELEIDPRFIPELEAMTTYDPADFDVGPDILGKEQVRASISLERAIRTAVNNNLEAQFARLAPAVSETQVVAAEAAFDWTFFSNSAYSSLDEPRAANSFSSVRSEQTEAITNTTGLRRVLSSGASVTIQQELAVTDYNTPGLNTSPDPATTVGFTAQIDQPLLRGFGSDTTLSQVRLARNDERDAIARLKQTLIDTVTNTERAYWQLYQAHRTLLIRQRYLDEGIKTRDYIRVRWKDVQDATEAQFADAVSRVQSRLTDLLTARRAFQAASDNLKALMNDPELTIGADALLVPADAALDLPVEYSLTDLLGTALTRRPEVDQAILSIDNTSIRLDVANNGRLPKLDLRLQTRFSGLGDDMSAAYNSVLEGNFISGLVGLNFEMPVGNRGPEAVYRRRVDERLQATIAYRNTIQQITLQVFSALRNLNTSYTQIEQTRNSRLAAANSLRAFLIEKEIKIGNTYEALNTEFERQDALTRAELLELAALVNYNTSIADLYAAAGTALEHNRIEFIVPNVGDTPSRSRTFGGRADAAE